MSHVLKNVYTVIQSFILEITFNMILNRIELVIDNNKCRIREISIQINHESLVVDLILVNAWHKHLHTRVDDVFH